MKITKIYAITILLAIYFVTLGFRIYWLTQKDGFMVDEGLSVTLAYYNDYMWTSNYPQNEKMKGEQVKNISLCDNGKHSLLRNTLGDIYRLWRDNRDSPHTNFYYSLLRLSLTGLKTGNIKTIIFRGGLLNLLLFSISFFVFFLLIKMLFDKNKSIPYIAVFCTFISTATISNTLLLRPYQLQETLFILFSYMFFKCIDRNKGLIINKKLFIEIRIFLLMVFIAALTLLTGYYATFFIGMFGIYAIYYNKKKGNNIEIVIYILIFAFSLMLGQTFYSKYLPGFLSGRAAETTQTLFGAGFVKNISQSVAAMGNFLIHFYFTIPVIIAASIILLYLIITKSKITYSAYSLCMLIISLLYMVIVTNIAPYKALRYSMAVFPFFIILVLLCVNSIKDKKVFCLSIVLLCYGFVSNAFNIKNIENVYKDKPLLYTFTEKSEIPVIVLNESYWKYAELVPYFNDDQIYIFCGKEDYMINLNKFNDCFFIIETSLIESGNYSIESFKKITEIGYFTCYQK